MYQLEAFAGTVVMFVTFILAIGVVAYARRRLLG